MVAEFQSDYLPEAQADSWLVKQIKSYLITREKVTAAKKIFFF